MGDLIVKIWYYYDMPSGVYIRTEEQKQKFSEMRKKEWADGKRVGGWTLSEEAKRKIGEAKKGKKNPNFGKHLSVEYRKKISIAVSGNKSYRWKGGITPLKKYIRECFKYRQWRSDIFTRDNFTCIWCGDNKGGDLNADHYPKSFAKILQEYNIKTLEQAEQCEELWNLNNGRTLCVSCHKKTDTWGRPKNIVINY